MKLVQKGNRQLRIQDDQLETMLAAGYTEVDQKTGKLLKKESKDAASVLKKENEALKKENETLKKLNQELTEQLAAVQKPNEE